MNSSFLSYTAPIVLAASIVATASGAVLFSEDFESVTLGPNVDETLAEANAWTATPPAGWTVNSSGVPGFGTLDDGVTEWAGWSFANKDWWVNAAGDQRRSEFILGTGNVAVADPDEWDDLPHADSEANGWYDTFVKSPAIGIVGGDTINVSFHSSWRPEFDDNYHQTANITASYNGGAAVEILRWESDGGSPNFHDAAPNEAISLDITAPADATDVVLEFGLFDAGNDWWWAIDNVVVSGQVPEPSTGLLALVGAAFVLIRRRR